MKKKKANIQIFSETENPIFDFEKTKLIARLKRGQQLKGRGIGFYLTIRREHVGGPHLLRKWSDIMIICTYLKPIFLNRLILLGRFHLPKIATVLG